MSIIINDNGELKDIQKPVNKHFFMTIIGREISSIYNMTDLGTGNYTNYELPDASKLGGSGTPKIRYIHQSIANGDYHIYESDYNPHGKMFSYASNMAGWGIVLPFKITRWCVIPREESNKHYNHYTTLDSAGPALNLRNGTIATAIFKNNSNSDLSASLSVDKDKGIIMFYNILYDASGDHSFEATKPILFVWGE